MSSVRIDSFDRPGFGWMYRVNGCRYRSHIELDSVGEINFFQSIGMAI